MEFLPKPNLVWPSIILVFLVREITTQQMQLVQFILNQSHSFVRPVKSVGTSTNLTLTMLPYQLLEIDEVNQFITTSVWMTETWHSEVTFWDPLKFGNITQLKLPVGTLWEPDVNLFNKFSLEMNDKDVRRLTNVIIITNPTSNTSLIMKQYPAIYRTSCTFHIQMFPFDTQVCMMSFTSITHDNCELDLFAAQQNVSLQYFNPNQQWDVLSFYVERVEYKYVCCPCNYTTLQYYVTIRRKPLFYTMHLVVPSVIVALINFLGFFTPSNSDGARNEKVSLGLTTLLAMGLLLLQLTDHTPKQSQALPLIALLLIGLIVLVGLGTILTMIIMHLQIKSNRKDPCPDYVRRACEMLQFVECRKPSCRRPQSVKSNRRNRLWTKDRSETGVNNRNNDNINDCVPLKELINHETCVTSSNIDKVDTDSYKTWSHLGDIIERISLITFVSVTLLLVCCFFGIGYINS